MLLYLLILIYSCPQEFLATCPKEHSKQFCKLSSTSRAWPVRGGLRWSNQPQLPGHNPRQGLCAPQLSRVLLRSPMHGQCSPGPFGAFWEPVQLNSLAGSKHRKREQILFCCMSKLNQYWEESEYWSQCSHPYCCGSNTIEELCFCKYHQCEMAM